MNPQERQGAARENHRDDNAMRVLMTADAIGGIWNYALELSRALQPYQIEVLLAVMGPSPSSSQRAEVTSIANISMVEHPFKLEWMDDCWDDLRCAGDWLSNLEQKWTPDIIHLNSYAYAALPFVAPKLVVAHSCVLSWWQAVHGEDAPETWHRYAMGVEEGLQGASIVIAPTYSMLAALYKHYRFSTETQVIANGVSPYPCIMGRRSDLVLSIGRFWDRAKNLDVLDRISEKIAWPIVAIGDAPQETTEKASSERRVLRLGRLSSDLVRQYLKSAAIFVSPALYEPFGLSILEAAFAGCALILSNISSLRENWESAAMLVDISDTSRLVATVNLLIENCDLRWELGRKARQRALTFSAERFAISYLQTYQRLFADSRRGLHI